MWGRSCKSIWWGMPCMHPHSASINVVRTFAKPRDGPPQERVKLPFRRLECACKNMRIERLCMCVRVFWRGANNSGAEEYSVIGNIRILVCMRVHVAHTKHPIQVSLQQRSPQCSVRNQPLVEHVCMRKTTNSTHTVSPKISSYSCIIAVGISFLQKLSNIILVVKFAMWK